MDKYKNFVRIEEMKGLLKAEKNEEALEIAQGIDVKKVKDNWDLMVIAEVYLKSGMLGRAKECYTMVYNKKKSRRVAMELVNICIRLKKVEEADAYFEAYRKMAPTDYYNYIFQYKIDRLKGKPLKEQAADLEALKKVEFTDTWGYELAKLYHKMGEREKCLKTCEDVIVWFGEGEDVDKAKTLRALYLGEISLKDISNPNAINDKADLPKPAEGENDGKISKVSSNLDIDVVIDYQMEFDHAVDEIMNQDHEGEEPEESGREEASGKEPLMEDLAEKDSFNDGDLVEISEDDKEGTETPVDGAAFDEAAIGKTGLDESHIDEAPLDEPHIDEAPLDETPLEETPLGENSIEVEYTEEELSIGDEVEEEDVKKYPEKNVDGSEAALPKEDIVVARHPVHDNDFFTDEIAKAVEQALKEDSDEKKSKMENSDPQEPTREWRKTDQKRDEHKTDGNRPTEERNGDKETAKDETIGEEQPETNGSPLLDAVERELGFVGVSEEKEEKKTVKKSWFERRKEKHKEKELRKKESEKRNSEADDREELERIRAAEREKQKFIENERKRDRQKYLAYKKQMASIANEKALERENMESASRDSEEFVVDINGIQEESDIRVAKDGIYTPKRMKCIDVPGNSIVNNFLTGRGRSLESYFGFFACQKNMSSQILKCLERLLDPEEEVMNYCIIGERGSGKKALAHGFARFMADCGKLAAPQTVWTDSNKINSIDLSEKIDKLKGRCLVIDQAGSLDREGIEDIAKVIERLHKKTMIVLADYPRNMVELFKSKEGFEDMFAPRIIIPSFSQDDLFDYVDYKVGTAGFVFDGEAYDLMSKKIKGIMRATEEGALARTEKYLVKTIDNAEQKNGEAYIRQTLEHEKHTRSNVITVECLPEGL